MSETNVIPLPVQFRPHVIQGEAEKPRPFGKRKPGLGHLAGGLGEVLDAALGVERPRPCADLKADLAARIRGAAQQLETLAQEAKSYGLLTTTIALNEHAGLLQAEAALVEAD